MSEQAARSGGIDAHIVLRDGSTMRVRSIQPGDDAGLQELHDRLSSESRYFRFLDVSRPGPAAVTRLLQADDMKDRLAKLGAEPMIMTPEQYDAFLREEFSVLGEVMRASGVKAQ